MKRCPTCNRTFADESLSYCTEDGTPLASDAASSLSASPDMTPTQAFNAGPAQAGWNAPAPYTPPVSSPAGKRSKLPWIIGAGVLLVAGLLIVSIIAGVLLAKRTDRNANANSSKSNLNSSASNQNSNVSRSNENSTTQTNQDESGAPTDEEEALAQLTKIENEWAEANIRGDKKYLENLLDDDYKGENIDGTTQTKEEYLEGLAPSETIKSHSLKDLNLNLTGSKATVKGLITVNFKAGLSMTYQFTDGFVWRGGEWKAVSSATSPVQ